MIVTLIAGGAGTRLWPLSTPDYPKHLLTVNGGETLLQAAYQRSRRLTSPDKIYVVTEASHAHHVKEQLPELPDEAFIIEPARRGTAGCIAAALAYLESRHDPDEPIAFTAADHYVRDVQGFVYSFRVGETVAKQHSRLVLVGVEPDYPNTGMGYIEKGERLDKDTFVFNVASFTEKPAYDLAKQYLKSGKYLWNCSYFVASLTTFKRVMQEFGPEMYAAYQKLAKAKPEEYEKAYLSLDTIAVDYALIENVTDLLVVPASFDWMDIGNFADMYKAVEHDEQGNHVSGNVELETVANSYIQNKETKPVAVIGLDNIVVVNTPDGILVTRKDLSQKVGEVSKRLQQTD